MNTRKKDLCKRARDKCNVPLPTVQKVVNAFLYVLAHAVIDGERVEFRNWGIWSKKLGRNRKARNFQTNEVIVLGRRPEVNFKPSKKFTELLRKGGK